MAKPSKSKNSSEDEDEVPYSALNLSEEVEENKHFSHPHNLILHQIPEGVKIDCSGCHLPGSGVVFVCWKCNFFLHEQCFRASRSMKHPSHPLHPLTLVPYPTYTSGSFICDSCGQPGSGFSFGCSTCDFDLHVHCACACVPENTTESQTEAIGSECDYGTHVKSVLSAEERPKQEIELEKFIAAQQENDAGLSQEEEENKGEKMTKKKSNKRRKLVIGCTSLEDSLAAGVIVNNVDILTQILLRVPTKSLIKFKCVSKHWLSLISDPQFSWNHTCRINFSLISGLYFYYKPWIFKELNSVSLHCHSSLPTLAFLNDVGEGSTPRIVHSCNGLLLCSKVYRKHYIVCNPTTQKYTALPEPGGTSSRLSHYKFGAYLAFDPSKSPHYKVVLVNCSSYYTGSTGSSYLIDIYSSESAAWKHICVSAPPGDFFTRNRVFWNGAIHWMSNENIHFRFDINAETLTGTTLPPYPKILSEEKILYFGECHGHLFLIQTRQSFPMGFRVLEMDRDSCCWNVKYRVSLRRLKAFFPENFHITFSVLCILKGPNEKDFSLVLAIQGKYISYSLDWKTWKVLRHLQPGDFHESTGYNNAFQFIETLCPV